MWTQFWDMHSGGGSKEPFEMIYIEAPEEEAKIIFFNRFGHNPERVTCTCCGEDYSIREHESLEQLTAYHRNCAYDKLLGKYIEEPDRSYSPNTALIPMEHYTKQPSVKVIFSSEIKPEERIGDIPQQGYIWI